MFAKMRSGEVPEGAAVLRARIDMAAPNLNMRDPVALPRHPCRPPPRRRGWRMYPMYDFAHPLEDAFEDITHSLCTLEFEDHRPLYDWVIENCQPAIARLLGHASKPRQIEFARLNLTYTVMSKRKLLKLVQDGLVSGWDDPRMPTLSGLRRRGVPPAAIRQFCHTIGITKATSLTDLSLLEHAIREALNQDRPALHGRARSYQDHPENWDAGRMDDLSAGLNPEDPAAGERAIPFSAKSSSSATISGKSAQRLFPPQPRSEVRLRHAYIIRCKEVIKDADGVVRACAAPSTWIPSAKTRKTGRSRASSIGFPPCTPCLPKSGFTTGCSPSRSPTRCPANSRTT